MLCYNSLNDETSNELFSLVFVQGEAFAKALAIPFTFPYHVTPRFSLRTGCHLLDHSLLLCKYLAFPLPFLSFFFSHVAATIIPIHSGNSTTGFLSIVLKCFCSLVLVVGLQLICVGSFSNSANLQNQVGRRMRMEITLFLNQLGNWSAQVWSLQTCLQL